MSHAVNGESDPGDGVIDGPISPGDAEQRKNGNDFADEKEDEAVGERKRHAAKQDEDVAFEENGDKV